jgi:SAM-dependent methyltransferase
MNQVHLQLCASPEWATFVEEELLAWALGGLVLGSDVLEVGAGPGMTTDVLRRQVRHLTAVELDDALAAALADRLAGTNVEVVQADATSLPFESNRFDAATCFTMLRHVPTADQQDRLLAEVQRVLRHGGLLVGTDSTASDRLAELHEGDIYVPIDPLTLPTRLAAADLNPSLPREYVSPGLPAASRNRTQPHGGGRVHAQRHHRAVPGSRRTWRRVARHVDGRPGWRAGGLRDPAHAGRAGRNPGASLSARRANARCTNQPHKDFRPISTTVLPHSYSPEIHTPARPPRPTVQRVVAIPPSTGITAPVRYAPARDER